MGESSTHFTKMFLQLVSHDRLSESSTWSLVVVPPRVSSVISFLDLFLLWFNFQLHARVVYAPGKFTCRDAILGTKESLFVGIIIEF